MSVLHIGAAELYPLIAAMVAGMDGPAGLAGLDLEARTYLADNARAFGARYKVPCAPEPIDWRAVLSADPRALGAVPALAYNLPPDASGLALAFVARAARVTGGLVR